MKKSVIVSILLLVGLTGTAFAAYIGDDWPGFPDVEKGSYYEEGVNSLYFLGVISGHDNGNFGPNENITRGQVATILDRYDQEIIEELRQENAYLKTLVCYHFEKENYEWNDYQTSWEEMCGSKMTP
jgi:hypothetical protein